MPAEVEAVVAVHDGLRDPADRGVGLIDRRRGSAKREDVRGRQACRARAEYRDARSLIFVVLDLPEHESRSLVRFLLASVDRSMLARSTLSEWKSMSG